MAVSADGVIGEDTSQISTDWTSKADKKSFIEMTKKHGVIIMGNTTFQTIGRPLPGRLNLILTGSPEKYTEKQEEGLLEFVKGTPQEIVTDLESRGFKSAILGGGSKTNAKFLEAKMVDEIILNVHPFVFGNGIKFTKGINLGLKLELLESKEIGDGVVQLRYKTLYE